jgi:MoaA/NifB/PqqE/SkfB family radical SAM enzyme
MGWDEWASAKPTFAGCPTPPRIICHSPHTNANFERRLRAMQRVNPDEDAIWDGWQAVLTSIGIEADGSIKGCPSLPTAAYIGRNIRERPLRELLEITATSLELSSQ